MIETRRTRKETSRIERTKRAWTLEGYIILGLMGLWAMLLVSLAPGGPAFLVSLVLFLIGAGLLSLTLVSGSAASQFFFAGAVGFTSLFIGLAVFGSTSINFGILCASATTFLCLDLLRLHELRRRNAQVRQTLLSTGLIWAFGIVGVSAVLVIVVARPGEATLSWGFLPAATIAVFALLVGLGWWAMSDRERTSGARYDAVILTPPAPSLADPFVAEAQHATAMMHGAPPPPPMKAPSLPPSAKTKRGRRGQ